MAKIIGITYGYKDIHFYINWNYRPLTFIEIHFCSICFAFKFMNLGFKIKWDKDPAAGKVIKE